MSQSGALDAVASNPQIPTLFETDSGSAIPIANTLNIVGINGITTSGSGNTVTIDGDGTIQSLTGNTGGAINPVTGNINLLGAGSITISGAGNTLTSQLTGLTNHAILVGAGTSTITKLALGTAGQVLQSGGAAADPVYSIATYPATTTINQMLYSSANNVVDQVTSGNNGVLVSGTTGIPSFLPNGTTGQVLTATTGGAPSWSTAPGSLGITSLTTNISGPVIPSSGAVAVTGTNIYSNGTVANTLTLNVQAASNLLLVGAGTNTPATTISTANQALLNTDVSGVPSWQTSVVISGSMSALGGYVGNLTGGSIFSPYIGQFIGPSTSPVSVVNNTAKTIVAVSVPAGVWDIVGSITYQASAITGTLFEATVSNTNNTRGSVTTNGMVNPYPPTTASGLTLTSPPVRVSTSSTIIYYLVGFALYSVGSLTAAGTIRVVRVG